MDNNLKNEITTKIKKVVNEYLSLKVDIKHLRKYFKNKTSFKNFLKDINYIGKKSFNNNEDYENDIRKILNDIIDDKEATIKDKKVSEGVVLNFNEFIKNNNI
jgi:uncharacterized protein YpuA (DUF1002 family)